MRKQRKISTGSVEDGAGADSETRSQSGDVWAEIKLNAKCYSSVTQLSLTFRTASSIAGRGDIAACLGRACHLHHQPTGQHSP
jgi:hypothetical protein